MTTSTGLRIDPDVLLDARRALLGHELDLGTGRLPPPDTGPTAALTARVLDEVAVMVFSVAHDLHTLAEALDRLVDAFAAQDDVVRSMLHRLAMRASA